MPGVSRVGVDIAGGAIIGVLAPSVYADGKNVAVLHAAVSPHGSGTHASAVMAQASSTVFANGIAICRSGDAASCGHIASGSNDVFAG